MKLAEYTIAGEKVFFAKATNRNAVKQAVDFEEQYFDTGTPYTVKEYSHIFDIGKIIFAQDADNRIIGIGSLTFGKESHPEIHIGDNDCYYSSLVVARDWRNKGIAKHILMLKEEHAKMRDVKNIITCVRVTNIRSLKILTNAGFIISDASDNLMESSDSDPGQRLILKKSFDCPATPNPFVQIAIDIDSKNELEIYRKIHEYKGKIQKQKIVGTQLILFLDR